MIINSSKELYTKFFWDIVDSIPFRIIILTYWLWCGIDSKGNVTNNICSTYKLLRYIEERNRVCKCTIVVGYDDVIPDIVFATSQYFENIEFVCVNHSHAKGIITSNGLNSFGSSNLNDSEWYERNDYSYYEVSDEDFIQSLRDVEMICKYRGEVLGIETKNDDVVNIDEIVRSI